MRNYLLMLLREAVGLCGLLGKRSLLVIMMSSVGLGQYICVGLGVTIGTAYIGQYVPLTMHC